MKKLSKLFIIASLIISLTPQVHAVSCNAVKMIRNKIEQDKEKRETLQEAIFLNEKLEEVSQWPEWSGVKKRMSLDEAETIFTAKETDILLLMDFLTTDESETYKEMGINLGYLSGSVAFSLVGSKIINKLLAHGYKSGFMKKIQKLIIDDVDNQKKATKIKYLASALMFITPAYLGVKEYELYKLLKEVKRKIEIIDDVANDLPELSLIDELIESNEITLQEYEAKLTEECL